MVHVIDTVLTVPATPGQTAINTGLTSLAGALAAAGLVDPVNALTDITIFAPSNDAFRAIGSAIPALSTQDLVTILGYHVLTQPIRFSTDLLAGDQITLSTLQGSNITVRRDGAQVFVNSAKVVLADVLTSNGVVHVLDKSVVPISVPFSLAWWRRMLTGYPHIQRSQPVQHYRYPQPVRSDPGACIFRCLCSVRRPVCFEHCAHYNLGSRYDSLECRRLCCGSHSGHIACWWCRRAGCQSLKFRLSDLLVISRLVA